MNVPPRYSADAPAKLMFTGWQFTDFSVLNQVYLIRRCYLLSLIIRIVASLPPTLISF